MNLHAATALDYRTGPLSVDIPEDIIDPEFCLIFDSRFLGNSPILFWTRRRLERGEGPEHLILTWNDALNLNASSSLLAPFLVVKNPPGVTQSIIGEPFVTVELKAAPSTEIWRQELTSATTYTPYPEQIRLILTDLLARAREETFEDGMESQFSKALVSYIKRYGNAAVEVLAEYILSEHVNAEIASEALRWVGHVNDVSTNESRLWLLGRGLLAPSPRVRDAATLGLVFLNDPQAIPALEAAIQRERIQELREDMEQALEDLKYPTPCR